MKGINLSRDLKSNFSPSRSKHSKKASKINEKSMSKERIGTQRSFANTFRIPHKNSSQVSYSRDRKSRQNFNCTQGILL